MDAVADAERPRYLATPQDDHPECMVLAGEGVDLIDDVPSARDLVERIITQTVATLRGGAAMIRA